MNYKGKYYGVKQHMLKKPTKWGVKVWSMVDSKSKFIFDFDINNSKNQSTFGSLTCTREQMSMAIAPLTSATLIHSYQ